MDLNGLYIPEDALINPDKYILKEVPKKEITVLKNSTLPINNNVEPDIIIPLPIEIPKGPSVGPSLPKNEINKNGEPIDASDKRPTPNPNSDIPILIPGAIPAIGSKNINTNPKVQMTFEDLVKNSNSIGTGAPPISNNINNNLIPSALQEIQTRQAVNPNQNFLEKYGSVILLTSAVYIGYVIYKRYEQDDLRLRIQKKKLKLCGCKEGETNVYHEGSNMPQGIERNINIGGGSSIGSGIQGNQPPGFFSNVGRGIGNAISETAKGAREVAVEATKGLRPKELAEAQKIRNISNSHTVINRERATKLKLENLIKNGENLELINKLFPPQERITAGDILRNIFRELEDLYEKITKIEFPSKEEKEEKAIIEAITQVPEEKEEEKEEENLLITAVADQRPRILQEEEKLVKEGFSRRAARRISNVAVLIASNIKVGSAKLREILNQISSFIGTRIINPTGDRITNIITWLKERMKRERGTYTQLEIPEEIELEEIPEEKKEGTHVQLEAPEEKEYHPIQKEEELLKLYPSPQKKTLVRFKEDISSLGQGIPERLKEDIPKAPTPTEEIELKPPEENIYEEEGVSPTIPLSGPTLGQIETRAHAIIQEKINKIRYESLIKYLNDNFILYDRLSNQYIPKSMDINSAKKILSLSAGFTKDDREAAKKLNISDAELQKIKNDISPYIRSSGSSEAVSSLKRKIAKQISASQSTVRDLNILIRTINPMEKDLSFPFGLSEGEQNAIENILSQAISLE